MRIGLLSPSIYMSPTSYGDMIFAPRDLSVALADGLVDRGHEVYFFTAPDIKTKASLIGGDYDLIQKEFIEEKLKEKPDERLKWASFYAVKRYYEMDLTEKCYKMALDGKMDIIHSYHDSLAHFSDEMTQFPTVYTLHDPLPKNENGLSYWLLNKFKYQNYVSVSKEFMKYNKLNLNFIDTVYHGIDLSDYQFAVNGEDLGFIGRMSKEKGMDIAIDIAKSLNKKISIATSREDQYKDLSYYNDVIKPRLTQKTVFTGFLDGNRKHDFLGNNYCLLFPILWEEPFGMVMIEAMACGTPVIAFARGSVQEIIKDGETGFIVNSSEEDIRGNWIIKKTGIEGFREAVERIYSMPQDQYSLMRDMCRKHVEQNFSVEKMVEGYEKVYQKILASKGESLRG